MLIRIILFLLQLRPPLYLSDLFITKMSINLAISYNAENVQAILKCNLETNGKEIQT